MQHWQKEVINGGPLKAKDMKQIINTLDSAITSLNALKKDLPFEIMEVLRVNSSTFPKGYVLASDPEESFLHESDYEDVVKDIINLIYK